jgi:hypothetical protein
MMFASNKKFRFNILVLLVSIVAFLILEANSAPVAKKRSFLSSTSKSSLDKKNNHYDLHSKTYDDLIDEIRLQLLANMLNNNNNNNNYKDDDDEFDLNDNSVEDLIESGEDDGRLEKRSRNFRHGETRSRVKLLHQQNLKHHNKLDAGDNSSQLRKAWEKNLYEKDRMYQNLLGGGR